tara:strand:- start:136 stop:1479 length:1344 start_codon:yes stop_codon:yes gene_type:complete
MVTKITDYSTTAASNTDVGGISLAEGWLPSTVNNLQRELLAQMAKASQAEAGWLELQNSITAGTTQTQTGSAAITGPLARVTTCANAGDGVKLPTCAAEVMVVIMNLGAENLQVWPNTSDTTNGGSANAVDANVIPPNSSRTYVGLDATDWRAVPVSIGAVLADSLTALGLGTANSPQFTGVELGHATDTTITRASAGDLNIEGNIAYRAGGTDVPVADGGTGVSTLTDGGILVGSGTGAVTAMAVLADSEMIVGDGTTDPVAESGATLRTSIGVGTGDSPQLTGIELGHATDSTITRASAGDINVEGNVVYRAGGTDVPVADGGTGVSTLTDGGILLGSGTGAITAMAVLATGEMIVGDGTTDPGAVSLSGDVTINSSGVVTIAATSVEGSMLNTNVISGQTALTSSLALTDELLVSDAGTLKRMDISLVTGLASADATALAIALG